MRAVGVRKFGGTDVLEVFDAPVPEPAEGEALVRVHFAGVNFVDIHMRRGAYAGSADASGPRILGREGAGEVVKVGAGVTTVKAGDRVAWCVTGASYAEVCAVPAWRLVPVPDDMPLDIACALQLQGSTAHYLARDVFPLAGGDIALVHSGAGGVGQILLQIAKARGVNVITTVGSDARVAIAKARGADLVVARDHERFRDRVREATGGAGCHVVYDAIGRDTFEDSLAACRRRGMLVLYGGASGTVDTVRPDALAEAGSIYLTRPHLTDFMQDTAEVHGRMADLIALARAGKLIVDVDRVLPLAEAGAAHTLLEERRASGKVLLKPAA